MFSFSLDEIASSFHLVERKHYFHQRLARFPIYASSSSSSVQVLLENKTRAMYSVKGCFLRTHTQSLFIYKYVAVMRLSPPKEAIYAKHTHETILLLLRIFRGASICPRDKQSLTLCGIPYISYNVARHSETEKVSPIRLCISSQRGQGEYACRPMINHHPVASAVI